MDASVEFDTKAELVKAIKECEERGYPYSWQIGYKLSKGKRDEFYILQYSTGTERYHSSKKRAKACT